MNKLKPNFTQIPNVFLDDWMYSLSPSQVKVALYIMRRTYGFQKNSDRISISQICKGIKDRDGNILDNGTGLSNRAVIDAINELERIGLIKTDKLPNKTTRITINLGGENSSLVKIVHTGSENSSQDVVKIVHTQKKEKESIQKKGCEASSLPPLKKEVTDHLLTWAEGKRDLKFMKHLMGKQMKAFKIAQAAKLTVPALKYRWTELQAEWESKGKRDKLDWMIVVNSFNYRK